MSLLNSFNPISFSHNPTPLTPLTRLSKHLGGPQIYIKRDDLTGLAFSGNKTRKLEYLMADAINQQASVILTLGYEQSNHALQTAAAASKLNLPCELIFKTPIEHPSSTFKQSGNILLQTLFGASITSTDQDPMIAMQQRAEALSQQGEKPYIIPKGGSNAIGALGYVECALEMIQQAKAYSFTIDHVVHATGSGGTQAGLVTGIKASSYPATVTGMGIRLTQETLEQLNYQLACDTAALLHQPDLVQLSDIHVNQDYMGEGYCLPTDAMHEAIKLLSQYEGIITDPIYTGKALAGLIDLIQKKSFSRNENVVFVHTGGTAALFAYPEVFCKR